MTDTVEKVRGPITSNVLNVVGAGKLRPQNGEAARLTVLKLMARSNGGTPL
jgi:hypothetical protein